MVFSKSFSQPQVDVPSSSKASELKDFMARELQLSPYTFKLQLDLGMVMFLANALLAWPSELN